MLEDSAWHYATKGEKAIAIFLAVLMVVALFGLGNALFNPEPDFECNGRNGIYRDYKAITVVTDDPNCQEGA